MRGEKRAFPKAENFNTPTRIRTGTGSKTREKIRNNKDNHKEDNKHKTRAEREIGNDAEGDEHLCSHKTTDIDSHIKGGEPPCEIVFGSTANRRHLRTNNMKNKNEPR
jgi:hypothetical protein